MYNEFRSRLDGIYDAEEVERLAVLSFEHVMNYRRIDISLNSNEPVPDSSLVKLESILKSLKSGKPIQYILGSAWFCEMKLFVNDDVLIPRRETEELVDWITKDIRESGKIPSAILDVCTGSGCIALALKKTFKQIRVTGIDISENALEVARMNSNQLNLEVEWLKMDATNISTELKPEIVVCNPPYVLFSEKDKMHDRVTAYEPSLALFVPDNDPLVFYKSVSEWVNKRLISTSQIYFEINEQMGKKVDDLLRQIGFNDIVVRKDMQGKDRMVRATKV